MSMDLQIDQRFAERDSFPIDISTGVRTPEIDELELRIALDLEHAAVQHVDWNITSVEGQPK